MRYVGGKVRQARTIASLILHRASETSIYWEPFLGGASVMAAVAPQFPGECRASDLNLDLVLLWRAARDGWVPPAVMTREEYEALRDAPPSPLRAWAAFAASYNGKWWGGYGPTASGRDYLAESVRSTIRKASALRGVSIECHSYDWCQPNAGDVVYCDPPYAGTLDYGATRGFDHEAFWGKMAEWSDAGVSVLVSEYAAPVGWEPVAEFRRVETMHHGGPSSGPRAEVVWKRRGFR